MITTKTIGELIKLSQTPKGVYEFTPLVFYRSNMIELNIFGEDVYLHYDDQETLGELWNLPPESFVAGNNPLFVHLSPSAVELVCKRSVTLSSSDEEYLQGVES